jgi:hypothetical protein
MNLFLSNGEKAEDAIYWGRKNVQAVMQDPSFLADVGLGLISITYLGPDPVKPESGNTRLGGDGGGDDDPSSAFNNSFGTSTTLGTASIALMAIGGAVVMVFVASVFVGVATGLVLPCSIPFLSMPPRQHKVVEIAVLVIVPVPFSVPISPLVMAMVEIMVVNVIGIILL